MPYASHCPGSGRKAKDMLLVLLLFLWPQQRKSLVIRNLEARGVEPLFSSCLAIEISQRLRMLSSKGYSIT